MTVALLLPTMDVERVSTDTVDRLSSMINSLSDIQSRLQLLRHAPPLLLKSSMPFSSLSIRKDFEELKELTDTIRSDSVQEALRTATNSEKADRSDLSRNGRREMRKRRQAFVCAQCPCLSRTSQTSAVPRRVSAAVHSI